MKQQEIRCQGCKEHFVVYVKKKLKLIYEMKGLPNCRHHDGSESVEDFVKKLKGKDEAKAD